MGTPSFRIIREALTHHRQRLPTDSLRSRLVNSDELTSRFHLQDFVQMALDVTLGTTIQDRHRDHRSGPATAPTSFATPVSCHANPIICPQVQYC